MKTTNGDFAGEIARAVDRAWIDWLTWTDGRDKRSLRQVCPRMQGRSDFFRRLIHIVDRSCTDNWEGWNGPVPSQRSVNRAVLFFRILTGRLQPGSAPVMESIAQAIADRDAVFFEDYAWLLREQRPDFPEMSRRQKFLMTNWDCGKKLCKESPRNLRKICARDLKMPSLSESAISKEVYRLGLPPAFRQRKAFA